MPISNITSSAVKGKNFIMKGINRLMDSKVGNAIMPENPTDLAATITLISTTTKDAINCYYYTTQSLKNEKIPKENRWFVAGIDLANGFYNVVTQFTLGTLVNKKSGDWFDKIFKGGFKVPEDKVAETMNQVNTFLKRIDAAPHVICTEKTLEKGIKGLNKIAKAGWKVIAVLVVTQIIAKRMIVPFLSTPTAGLIKKWGESHEAKRKGINPDNKPNDETKEPLPINYTLPYAAPVKNAFGNFDKIMNPKEDTFKKTA